MLVQSTELAYLPKLYTLAEDIWYKIQNDLGIKNKFRQKDGWYELMPINGEWWLHLVAGFQWDGASGGYPDYDWIMMPSAIHDTLHWLIMHGIIEESYNNAIDKELQDAVLNSKTPIPLWQGGNLLKKYRARIVRIATNTCKEKRNLQGIEHTITRIPI